MSDQYSLSDRQSYQALEHNQLAAALDGFGVINGCTASINTGTLGSNENTLTLDAGSVLVDGSQFDISSQSVDVPASATSDRKDLLVIEADGSVTVRTGDPEAAHPDGTVRQNSERPSPDTIETHDATVLHEIWVPADATSISADDLIPRRHFVNPTVGDISAQTGSVEAEPTDPTDIARKAEVDAIEGGDRATQVIEAPNDGITTAGIPNNDHAERTVIVPDGSVLTLYTWGGYTVPSMTAPTGVEVRLLSSNETVLTSANTVRQTNSNGIHSASNSSGSDSLYLLRLVNESGTDYSDSANDALGAFFGYAIE